jgi:predicted nucleic acid-binding protein
MNMIIVDTSVWIQYLNGDENPWVEKLDELLGTEIITIADLIYMEILQGISNKDQFNKTKRILDRLDRINLGGFDLTLKAAINYNQIRVRGFTIRKSIDVLIGTYCHENGCRLLHNDKDFVYFSKCFKLNIIDPTV